MTRDSQAYPHALLPASLSCASMNSRPEDVGVTQWKTQVWDSCAQTPGLLLTHLKCLGSPSSLLSFQAMAVFQEKVRQMPL